MSEAFELGLISPVAIAPRDAVEAFAPEVARVLDALGYFGALVTDESQVYDFGLSNAAVRGAAVRLGIRVSQEDYLYAVAFRLRVKERRGHPEAPA
jgi:hypothetical protein